MENDLHAEEHHDVQNQPVISSHNLEIDVSRTTRTSVSRPDVSSWKKGLWTILFILAIVALVIFLLVNQPNS